MRQYDLVAGAFTILSVGGLTVQTASFRLFGAQATAMIFAIRGPFSPPVGCTTVLR